MTYEPVDITIAENNKKREIDTNDPLQINGYYELSADTEIYDSPDAQSAFDTLEKGSTVKVLGEREGDFIRVDYFGNQGYVRLENLNEI